MKKRVVVTGMGTVSSLGNDISTLIKNIKNGNSGIKKITDNTFENLDTKIAGIVEDYNPNQYLTKKEIKRYDRSTQFGAYAAMQAIEFANIDLSIIDKSRAGVFIGSGAGGLHTLLNENVNFKEKGSNRVSPFLIPTSIINMISGFVAIKTGFTGPSYAISSACASSNHSIGEAYRHIAHGYADVMLAGGAESTIHPLYFAGFNKMNAMSTQNETPTKASRPFDVGRDGFVMSEGAGVLFLESYEHAKNRNANIIGEIIGYAATTDAYHITSPHFEGAQKAIEKAVDFSSISLDQIDYINMHGTSTPTGDLSEVQAIEAAFGHHSQSLKVSSTKSMTGHLFGAAGGIEAIITLESLANNFYPPTINIDKLDPECSLDVIPNKAEYGNMNYALSNGFGFGGHNAVLVFKKLEE